MLVLAAVLLRRVTPSNHQLTKTLPRCFQKHTLKSAWSHPTESNACTLMLNTEHVKSLKLVSFLIHNNNIEEVRSIIIVPD